MITALNKKLIVVAGLLAAGKTTFALKLSHELQIPCFSKDLLKNAMGRSMPVNSRDESKLLSATSFDAIEFITERFMEAHLPLIIEANFRMDENHGGIREGEKLQELAERYGYRVLTFLFTGDPSVLHKRYKERENRPERGHANRLWSEFSLEDYENSVSLLGCFDIGGKIIKIDSTDFGAVDFEHHIEQARSFIGFGEADFTMF